MNKKIGLYDRLAKYYDVLDSYGEKNFYRFLRYKYISPIRNKTILEVGIGTGKNIEFYHTSNSVLGIDTSAQMLLESKRKILESNKDVSLKYITSNPWSLPHNYYEVVIASFVLCTQTDKTIRSMIHELHRVLRQGGDLILFEWTAHQFGLRGFATRLISPFLKILFGPSAYRKASLVYFLDDKEKWVIKKVDMLSDNETHAVILTKK